MQREYKNMSLTHNRACLAPLWLKDVMVYSTTHFVRPFPFVRVWFFPRLSLQSQRSSFHTLTLVHAHTLTVFIWSRAKSKLSFCFSFGFLIFLHAHNEKYYTKTWKDRLEFKARKNCISNGNIMYKIPVFNGIVEVLAS